MRYTDKLNIASYTETGRRNNNEDYLCWDEGVFVVCDGIGGESRGEVASRLVAGSFVSDVNNAMAGDFSGEVLLSVLENIQSGLNKRLKEHPEERGMGTTLAAMVITRDSGYVLHIGDSRVYFVKPERGLYWRTDDHSVVAELVKSGVVDEQEARLHPLSNRITRAIQSNAEGKTSGADLCRISHFEPGDMFFLSTDGVQESLDDPTLLKLLTAPGLSAEEIIENIRCACSGSQDNNSAILIRFPELKAPGSFPGSPLQTTPAPLGSFRYDASLVCPIRDVPETEVNHGKNPRDRKSRLTGSLGLILKIAFYTFIVLMVLAFVLSALSRSG